MTEQEPTGSEPTSEPEAIPESETPEEPDVDSEEPADVGQELEESEDG